MAYHKTGKQSMQGQREDEDTRLSGAYVSGWKAKYVMRVQEFMTMECWARV